MTPSSSLSESVASYATSTSASIAERTMTTALGRITKTPAISGEGLFLTSEHMGYASNGAWSTYISSSGEFLYKIDDDNLISYSAQSGSSLIIKTNEAILSGSSITLLTDKFFFGNSGSAPFEGSYISGSGGSLEISSSNFFLKEDGTLIVGAGDFTVDTDGNITGSDVRFTGGRIAGWILDGDKLHNPNASLRINGRTATPKITIGNHSFESAGIQLCYHSDGTLGFYAGDGSNDYIQYFVGSGVNIKTENLVASGSSINLGAPSFRLGGATSYISGSGGNIEIKSNNFELDTSGNVKARGSSHIFDGEITAHKLTVTGSGNIIGGWNVDSNAIYYGTEGSNATFTSGNSDITLGAGFISAKNFYLDTSGNARIAGNISASAGNIGGWTLGSGTLKSADITGTADGTDTTTTGMVIGGTGYIAGPNFLLNTSGNVLARGSAHTFDGTITAHTLEATGSGRIGGFYIGGNDLYSKYSLTMVKCSKLIRSTSTNFNYIF